MYFIHVKYFVCFRLEIKPVNPKGNQPWIFIGRTGVEAETPILWLPNVENWLIRKDPDAGIDWRQEEKGMTENELVGWHHWLCGHEFEQALGVGDGQGRRAVVHGVTKLDMTEWLNWTELETSPRFSAHPTPLLWDAVTLSSRGSLFPRALNPAASRF